MIFSTNYINRRIKSLVFGDVSLSETGKEYYKTLNKSFITLCRSLPEYMQNPAMFFLLDYFHIKVGEPVDFMYYYYKPLWNIIIYINESGKQVHDLTQSELETAMFGEAMSLFLHSLDDHLNDSEIPCTHLTLLLRSQAWLLFRKAINEFASGKEQFDFAQLLLNDYYTGIYTQSEPLGLDEYCNRFRKEMSTMNIIPLLAAYKITENPEFTEKTKYAMESFGIAWRILDDIQDAGEDVKAGTHTALYHALPGEAKKIWDTGRKNTDVNRKTGILDEIFRELEHDGIFERLMERIIRELNEARKTVKALGMYGMAGQYMEIGEPVKKLLNELKNIST